MKLSEFKKYFNVKLLNEKPVARDGEWNQEDEGYSISLMGLDSYYKLLMKLETGGTKAELRRLDDTFVIGYIGADNPFKENRFNIIFKLDTVDESIFFSKLGLSNILRVSSVLVAKNYRMRGLSTFVYKYIVNDLGYSIISDFEQYFGARKLWSRLSKDSEIIVDVINIKDNVIIDKNVELKHGKLNDEFDERYWSKDLSKKDIRFILRKIKWL